MTSNAFDALYAGVTAAISVVLAAKMFSSARGPMVVTRRAWALAFLLAAIAAGLQVSAFISGGWFATGLYRLYLVAATLVPGVMGVGSLYLLAPRRVATAGAILVGLIAVGTVAATATASLSDVALLNAFTASTSIAKATPSLGVGLCFAAMGILGAGAMIVGGAISILKGHRRNPPFIVAGALAFAGAGSMAALGYPALFFGAQVIGVVLLFVGATLPSRTRVAVRQASSQA